MWAHEADGEEEGLIFVGADQLDGFGGSLAIGVDEVVAFGDVVFKLVAAPDKFFTGGVVL